MDALRMNIANSLIVELDARLSGIFQQSANRIVGNVRYAT